VVDGIIIPSGLFFFKKKKGSRTQTMTQNFVERVGVSYTEAKNKRFRNAIPACVLQEQHSGMFHHKNTPVYTYTFT
jgi:hypothetical protein